jgi:rhomboid protease GluP
MRMHISNARTIAWGRLRRIPCTAGMLVVIWMMFGVEVFTHALGHPATLLHLGALPTTGIVHGEYWRLLSYALLHSGWWHIGLNTALLLLAGPVVERALGARATLAISLLGAILGGVAVLFVHHGEPASYEVGASGAFFALLGAGLMVAWRQPPSGSLRLYRRLRTVLIIGLAISFAPGVSMAAHLSGLAVGSIHALAMRFWKKRQFRIAAQSGSFLPENDLLALTSELTHLPSGSASGIRRIQSA